MQAEIIKIFRRKNKRYLTQIDLLRELNLTTDEWIEQRIDYHLRKLEQTDKLITYKIGQTTVYQLR